MKGAKLDNIKCETCDYCEQNLITGKWYCQMNDDRKIVTDRSVPEWCPVQNNNNDEN